MNDPRHAHVRSLLAEYDPSLPLERAWSIPRDHYRDPLLAEQERASVFGATWQYVASLDELSEPGQYVSTRVGHEPVVVVRTASGLAAFYNVCRHHAAEVVPTRCGRARSLKCRYHGWTYGLDGALRAAPLMEGAELDLSEHGLVPLPVSTWERFVFVHLGAEPTPLDAEVSEVAERVAALELESLRHHSRRVYELDCNWKVFVDNYLDGGYHVPTLHKDLAGVLSSSAYAIEVGRRGVLQTSPIVGGAQPAAAVRRGSASVYYWLYPNFMVNWYEGVMDVNVVVPVSAERCQVVFDLFFADDVPEDRRAESLELTHLIQLEDEEICASVQRGLASRSYRAGRLSVKREAGAHLFHRLLSADLARSVA